MRRFLRNNSLSLVIFGVFFSTLLGGQMVTGEATYNDERKEHGLAPITMGTYLRSSHFLEATMENWESEFLQMAFFVILSAFLYQKGSAESKDPDGGGEEVDEDPKKHGHDPQAPWPVRVGGMVLWLYSYSLSIAFLILFAGSFYLHVVGGVRQHNEEALMHGDSPLTLGEFMGSSEFWFQSFQNWQSEFLAIGCMVVFSIWLRHRGSPESKPVHAAHSDTGK